MKYLLDTNTCIRFLTGRSSAVVERLAATPETDVCLCSIVKLELRFRALNRSQPERTLAQQPMFVDRFVSLPFDDAAHFHAAENRIELAKRGTPIGPYDLLIAAIASANSLTLVTHDTREFERVARLRIEDWE